MAARAAEPGRRVIRIHVGGPMWPTDHRPLARLSVAGGHATLPTANEAIDAAERSTPAEPSTRRSSNHEVRSGQALDSPAAPPACGRAAPGLLPLRGRRSVGVPDLAGRAAGERGAVGRGAAGARDALARPAAGRAERARGPAR